MGTDDQDTAVDVFSLLGDETRLRILRELADAARGDYAPRSEPVSYAELMDRVGLRDSGNFNYHLSALQDRFVEKAEDGYRIRRAGQEIVRALRAGDLTDEGSLDPTRLDERCPLCGAHIEVAIEDGWLLVTCTECAGLYGATPSVTDGLFFAVEVSPAIRQGRDVEELFRTVLVSTQQYAHLGVEGICHECAGPVDADLEVCRDHESEADGGCEACGRPTPAFARGECGACGLVQVAPVAYSLWNHEPTRRRLHDAGVAVDPSAWARATEPLTWDCTVEDRGGATLLTYQIPVAAGGDPVVMTVDEEFAVRSIE